MIKTLISKDKEDIKEYVKYILLYRNKKTVPVIIIYFICLLLICVTGIVLSFMWDMFFSLAIICVVMCLLLLAITLGFLVITIKKYTKDLFAAQSVNKYTSADISILGILLSSKEQPDRLYDWGMVTNADFYKNTAYYTLANGILLIIYEKDITHGSFGELQELTNEKLVKQDG